MTVQFVGEIPMCSSIFNKVLRTTGSVETMKREGSSYNVHFLESKIFLIVLEFQSVYFHSIFTSSLMV